MSKLFPTPDSLPFDVEEVYKAIEDYQGYGTSRIVNRCSPRLVKELKKCGWSIDEDGYVYPTERFKFPTLRLYDQRAKTCAALACLSGTMVSLFSFCCSSYKDPIGPFLVTAIPVFIVSYCFSYLIHVAGE